MREAENLDGDDTEGYPFEPVINLPLSPPPIASLPDEFSHGPSPGPSTSNAILPLPPLSLLDHTQPPPLKWPPPHTFFNHASGSQPFKKPKYARGSKEDIRRKGRANAKRAVARLDEKRAAPYGDYVVKPRLVNKHVRPAAAVHVKYDAMKLRHTKSAYTGGRLKGSPKRIYSLDELVGDGSKFKFRLESWDGR